MTANKLLIAIVFFCCLLVSVYAPRTASQFDCANAEAAEAAIQNAWDQENKTAEAIEFIRKAEALAQPPECDIAHAISLAEWATHLARSTVPEVRVPTKIEQQSIEINKILKDIGWFKLLIGLGIYLALIITHATAMLRGITDTFDKMAVVALTLLYFCLLVPVSWSLIFAGYYGLRERELALPLITYFWEFFSGLVLAGIPGMVAQYSIKGAKRRRNLAIWVMRFSYYSVALGIGLLVFVLSPVFVFFMGS